MTPEHLPLLPYLASVPSRQLGLISDLAHEIWPECYRSILTSAQIEYMLQRFYSPESLAEQLAQGQIFHVVELSRDGEKKVVGYVAYTPLDFVHGLFHLDKIYLKHSARGSGVGAAVLDGVISMIESLGARTLTLEVNRLNSVAINFYFKMGFQIDNYRDLDIGNGFWMNDFVMSKKLPRDSNRDSDG